MSIRQYPVSTVNRRIMFIGMGCECNKYTSQPVKTILSWSTRSPYEVHLDFWTGRQSRVEWDVAFDLLTDGLRGPAGLGDVSILPSLDDPARLELILSSPSHPHPVGLTVLRNALEEFMAAVQAASGVTTGKGT